MTNEKPDLRTSGFKKAGEWMLTDRVRSGIEFRLDCLADERTVYAFVVNGDSQSPVYIGVCDKDSTTLRERMRRFQSCAGAGTNKRVAGRIKEYLASGHSVQIFALKPSTSHLSAGVEIDVVKGLVNPLTQLFKPVWNRR